MLILASGERRLTLEEKIRKAQDKVRERATKRWINYEEILNEGGNTSPSKLNGAENVKKKNSDENVVLSKNNYVKENDLDFTETNQLKRLNHEVLVENLTVEGKNTEEVPSLNETTDESKLEDGSARNDEISSSSNKELIRDSPTNINLSSDSNNLKADHDFEIEENDERNDVHRLIPTPKTSDAKFENENDTLNEKHDLVSKHLQTSVNIKEQNEDEDVILINEQSKEVESNINNEGKIHILSGNALSQDEGAAGLPPKIEDTSFENIHASNYINDEIDNTSSDKFCSKTNVEITLESKNEDIDLPLQALNNNHNKHVDHISCEDVNEIVDSSQNIDSTGTEITNKFEDNTTFLSQPVIGGQDFESESGNSIKEDDVFTHEQPDLSTIQNINSNSNSDDKILDDIGLKLQNVDQQSITHDLEIQNNQNVVSQDTQQDFFTNADITTTDINGLINMNNGLGNEVISESDLRKNNNQKIEVVLDEQISLDDFIQSYELESMVIDKDTANNILLENVEDEVEKPEGALLHDLKTDSIKEKTISSQDENTDSTLVSSLDNVKKQSTDIISEEMENEKPESVLINDEIHEKSTLDELNKYGVSINKKLSTEGTDDSVSSNNELDSSTKSQNNNDSLQINNAMDLETAAITIQKVFRSFLFRSRTSTLDDIHDSDSLDVTEYVPIDNNSSRAENDQKVEEDYLNRNVTTERPRITRMDTMLQTVNEEKSLSGSTDDSSLSSAATIIQAHVRGFLARNKLNSYKNSSTSSLLNSVDPPIASVDTDLSESHKNKTVLNIHIVPEGNEFISKEESITTSVDLPPDLSPPSSKLHPLGYDKSVRRKQLKREDAVQSVSPPSNNSGKLSEDEPVKALIINDAENLDRETIDGDLSDVNAGFNSCDTTPTNSATMETVVDRTDNEDSYRKEDTSIERRSRAKSIDVSSDEMDVVTPFTPRDTKSETLMHSGEFHDTLVPTRVVRSDSSVVRGE
ncbi:hypothetical protein EVAR_9466_1 [Eumeta japonica]|uniref:Uncharacterized protein n=1 Tax=Eumeta variegata TaxID=151549 RepID=A0A4C1UE21_EUMVA|nr:hypothetical protein EVAR_9466_1 [Eumeta japonica]